MISQADSALDKADLATSVGSLEALGHVSAPVTSPSVDPALREQHFRSFVENANDIIFVTDPQGRFTYLSPNYGRTFGVDSDQLLGQHFI